MGLFRLDSFVVLTATWRSPSCREMLVQCCAFEALKCLLFLAIMSFIILL